MIGADSDSRLTAAVGFEIYSHFGEVEYSGESRLKSHTKIIRIANEGKARMS